MNRWLLARAAVFFTASAVLVAQAAQSQSTISAEQLRQAATAKVAQSTVRIHVEGKKAGNFPSLPGFDFSDANAPANKQEFKNEGTGFVIDAAKGEIVTTGYNIEDGETITITLADGSTRKASVVGIDKGADVAVLRIDPSGLVAANWSDDAKTGEDCAVYGQAGDLGLIATFGTVAGVKLHSQDPQGDIIAITAPEAMGMAGAPVFDMKGRVIGMAYARLDPNRNNVGVGVVLAADTVKSSVAAVTTAK